MDRVTRLETNDTRPTTLGEQLARLRWCIAILRKSLMLQGYYAHRATQQYITLLVHRLHTRMSFFSSAIDLAGLMLLIIAKLLFNRHHSLERTLLVHQRNLQAFLQTGCSLCRC